MPTDPGLGGLGESVHERDQTGRTEDRSRDVVGGLAVGLALGDQGGPPTNATTAIGTLMYRHQRHEAYSVSAPPRIRPIAAPAPAMAP